MLAFRSPTQCNCILPTLLFEGRVVLPLHRESSPYDSVFVWSCKCQSAQCQPCPIHSARYAVCKELSSGHALLQGTVVSRVIR